MIEFSCDLAFQLWSPYGWIATSHLAYLLKGAIVYQVLVVGIYLSNSDYLCHQVLGILIGAKSVRFISQ